MSTSGSGSIAPTGTTSTSILKAILVSITRDLEWSPKRPRKTLSFEEARRRAWQAAKELEELFDTPDETSEAKRTYFASEYMALLAENFVIAPPETLDRSRAR